MEFKLSPLSMKAAGDGEQEGTYEGLFSIFDNVDDGNDIAHRGMFEKTIQERGHRVKVFYAHDFYKLIGPTPEVLREEKLGLYSKGRLSITRGNTRGSFWADEVYALMKDGALNEGSFGYDPIKFQEEVVGDAQTRKVIRHLLEVKLYEISPVPLGMNPMTQVSVVKAAISNPLLFTDGAGAVAAQQELLALVPGYLKGLEALGVHLKEGRTLSAKNRQLIQDAMEAIKNVQGLLGDLLQASEPAEEPKKLHSSLADLQLKMKLADVRLRVLSIPD